MYGVASGNITPSSFVVQTTTADHKYTLASSASVPIAGVSGPGTRYPPYAGLDDGFIAVAGEDFELHKAPMNDVCPLQLGGTVAAGDLLTTDASGHGVTASSGNQVGAQALEAGVSGQLVSVRLSLPSVRAA